MYFRGLGAYYFKNGQPASVLYVGDTMTFNVPGYSQVWLDQYQNGQLQFSGVMSLPMPPYTLLARDAGTFTASVSKVGANGKKSDSIGTDTIKVLASVPATSQPIPQTGKATGTCYAGSVPVASYPDGSCPPGSVGSPAFVENGAPGYVNPAPGGGIYSGFLPSGMPTASQPLPSQPFFVQPPSGPLDIYGVASDTGDMTPVGSDDGGVLGALGYLWPALLVGGLIYLSGRKNR